MELTTSRIGNILILMGMLIGPGLIISLGIEYFRRVRELKKDLKYYHETFRVISGGNLHYSSYLLLSTDCGKTWWNISNAPEGGYTILGPADEQLIQEIKAWDALSAYGDKNGPIGKGKNITDDEIKLLKDAGFQVSSKN